MAEVNVNVVVNVLKLNKDGSREDLTHLLGRPFNNKDNKKSHRKRNV